MYPQKCWIKSKNITCWAPWNCIIRFCPVHSPSYSNFISRSTTGCLRRAKFMKENVANDYRFLSSILPRSQVHQTRQAHNKQRTLLAIQLNYNWTGNTMSNQNPEVGVHRCVALTYSICPSKKHDQPLQINGRLLCQHLRIIMLQALLRNLGRVFSFLWLVKTRIFFQLRDAIFMAWCLDQAVEFGDIKRWVLSLHSKTSEHHPAWQPRSARLRLPRCCDSAGGHSCRSDVKFPKKNSKCPFGNKVSVGAPSDNYDPGFAARPLSRLNHKLWVSQFRGVKDLDVNVSIKDCSSNSHAQNGDSSIYSHFHPLKKLHIFPIEVGVESFYVRRLSCQHSRCKLSSREAATIWTWRSLAIL